MQDLKEILDRQFSRWKLREFHLNYHRLKYKLMKVIKH